jgi:hypothetical protein
MALKSTPCPSDANDAKAWLQTGRAPGAHWARASCAPGAPGRFLGPFLGAGAALACARLALAGIRVLEPAQFLPPFFAP